MTDHLQDKWAPLLSFRGPRKVAPTKAWQVIELYGVRPHGPARVENACNSRTVQPIYWILTAVCQSEHSRCPARHFWLPCRILSCLSYQSRAFVWFFIINISHRIFNIVDIPLDYIHTTCGLRNEDFCLIYILAKFVVDELGRLIES